MLTRPTQWAIVAVLLVNPWTLGWALQTWWSAATPQGQVAQACRAAHLAVIEIGAGTTPTRCYRTIADWHAGEPVMVGGGR